MRIKKVILKIFLISFFAVLSSSLAMARAPSNSRTDSSSRTPSTKKSKYIESETGLNIPSMGIAIDAIYQPELDNLIPGYKILNIVLTNKSSQNIQLNPNKDRWIVRDNVDKKHIAINHLRFLGEKVWEEISADLRNKLEYPQIVRSGNNTKIDVFFPATTNLANFRSFEWKSFFFKKEFLLTNPLEKDLKLDDLTRPTTQSITLSNVKYDGKTPEEPKVKKESPPPAFDPKLDDFSITVD